MKAVYKDDVAYNPIPVGEGLAAASNEEIITACKKALIHTISHWTALIDYVKECRGRIQELIRQARRAVDTTTARAKAQAGAPQEKVEEVVQEYLAECWNFRRQCPKNPELPRHLLRAFLYVVRPCLPRRDIEYAVSGSEVELWNRLAGLLVPKYTHESSDE